MLLRLELFESTWESIGTKSCSLVKSRGLHIPLGTKLGVEEDKYSSNIEKATAIPLAIQTLWVIAPWLGKIKGRQRQHRSEYLSIYQHPARD